MNALGEGRPCLLIDLGMLTGGLDLGEGQPLLAWVPWHVSSGGVQHHIVQLVQCCDKAAILNDNNSSLDLASKRCRMRLPPLTHPTFNASYVIATRKWIISHNSHTLKSLEAAEIEWTSKALSKRRVLSLKHHHSQTKRLYHLSSWLPWIILTREAHAVH